MKNCKTSKNIRRKGLFIQIEKIIFTDEAKFTDMGFERKIACPQCCIITIAVGSSHHRIGKSEASHDLWRQLVIDSNAKGSIGHFFGKYLLGKVARVSSKPAENTHVDILRK